MAKKIDFAALKGRLKKYMFDKGERVGLFLCVAIAVLLMSLGMWNGLTAGRPKDGDTWQSVIKGKVQGVDRAIAAAQPNVAEEKKLKEDVSLISGNPWPYRQPWFIPGPWFGLGDGYDTKRRNPVVLPLVKGDQNIQMDYIKGGYRSYAVDLTQETVQRMGGAGKAPAVKAGSFVTILKPQRIVVVSAIFPLKEQLEEYQKALRISNMKLLLAKEENIPNPLGLNVYRCEILRDGTATPWEFMYRYNADKDTVEVEKRIDEAIREAYLDTETHKYYPDQLIQGLATPLMKLSNAKYPHVLLPGISGKFPEEPKKGGPGKEKIEMPGGGKKDPNKPIEVDTAKPATVSFKDLKKEGKSDELLDKFNGKYNLFNPIQEDRKGSILIPKLPTKEGEYADVLVRFFDVGVEPGKTYRYSVQVRMKSPNFEHKDAAFQELAKIKDLYSPFTVTPEIRIPYEYDFYAVDQKPEMEILDGPDKGTILPKETHEKIAVQIHRWIDYVDVDTKKTAADWAIAERVLVRRGDYIGRKVYVEVPTWSERKDAFELAAAIRPGVKGKATDKRAIGWPVEFQEAPDSKSLLVDFAPGKHGKEESASELLILTPEGKLIVRNSRIDTEADNPIGIERVQRFNSWRDRVRQLRDGTGKEK